MSDKRPPAIRALVEHYLDRFNRSDFQGALACYHLPFTWFFGASSFSVATPHEFLATMAKMKGKLVAGGLGRSDLQDLTIRMLGESAALAGVAVSRRRADGSELELTGGSYLVHDQGEGWRLAAFVGHPLEQIVPGEKA